MRASWLRPTGQYDLALAEYRRTLEQNPSFVFASWLLAQALEQTGQHEEAIAELERALEIAPDRINLRIELGCAYAAAGRAREALAIVEELRHREYSDGRFVDPGYLDFIPAQLGERHLAFDLLDQAVEERSSAVLWLRAEPKLDLLRADPRFERLLDRIRPELSAGASPE